MDMSGDNDGLLEALKIKRGSPDPRLFFNVFYFKGINCRQGYRVSGISYQLWAIGTEGRWIK
jgi:hypothetical protein